MANEVPFMVLICFLLLFQILPSSPAVARTLSTKDRNWERSGSYTPKFWATLEFLSLLRRWKLMWKGFCEGGSEVEGRCCEVEGVGRLSGNELIFFVQMDGLCVREKN